MALKNHLKKLLTGLEIPQEYVCVGFETLQPSVSIFLEGNGQEQSLNVTSTHLFLGYKPLIIGFTFSLDDKNYNRVKDQPKVTLELRCGEHSVASLSLVKIGEKILNRDVVLYFEGKHGMHSFLNPIHQWINQQRERLRKNTPNNISLSGNLLDQVRIAYCIPRIISIITVSDGTLINMFPTDLHGAVGEKNYASSLRKGGLANMQVEKYNKIVISDVDTSFCKQAYTLGKNHMHEMTDMNAFSTYVERSAKLKLPLPKSVLRYKELSRIDSFDHNIHRIHLYEVIHAQTIESGKSTLAHIHQYYAQWRLDQSFPTQMILR